VDLLQQLISDPASKLSIYTIFYNTNMKISDYKKQLKELYLPPSKFPVIVEVPEFKFIMFDGAGAPADKSFQEAIGALYGIIYTIKFMPKAGVKVKEYYPFKVPALEGLWWTKSGSTYEMKKYSDWLWTVMIMVPDFVDNELLEQAKIMAGKKKPEINYSKVRLETFKEGKAVQIMHVGPYDQEAVNLKKMEDFATAQGLKFTGKHHEIYMSDPRRTKPDKIKTVLRHPVA